MNSMTGFGRAEGVVQNYQVTIEVKSVNHRFLDSRFRLPNSLSSLEIPLNEQLRKKFERGSFEINIRQKPMTDGAMVAGNTRFVLDTTALRTLNEACSAAAKELHTPENLTLEMLIHSNRVFIAVEETQEANALLAPLQKQFDTALKALAEMREREGEKLKKILLDGISQVTEQIPVLKNLTQGHSAKVREKLSQKIQQWKIGEIDPQRLEWEIAFLVERSDITEELDRLESHTKEFRRLLNEKVPIGRKLDFMSQELHREVNTLGSKTSLIEITNITLSLKAIIEKLREQIQNVE